MGLVLKQSSRNTLILFLGFAIGGLNVLFLYTHFLHEDYYGLVTFLLSTANILLPLLVFGMQHSIIKFYSTYQTKLTRDTFLSSALFLPLLVIIPIGLVGAFTYETIANWISNENAIIKPFTYLIFLVAIFMGYFEVFYAFSKVQLQSVVGNFIKEIFNRICTSVLLVMVYFNLLTEVQFVYAIVLVYALRALLMMFYTFKIYKPVLVFKFPANIKEILNYSFYMIMAGSAGGILLEIDKFMIPQLEQIAQVAYYSVGIYIASVISIPSRAMQQIANPLTAKELNNNNLEGVEKLYKKSSITLLIAGGLLFLLINLNIKDLYLLIAKPEYAVGVSIVLLISISEMYKLALGTNGAILSNSKYFRIFFYLSILMAFSVIILNRWLIALLGIDGAALATLIVVLFFNTFRVYYLKKKLNMQPFSKKTLMVLGMVLLFYLGFYFIPWHFHPFLNITLKSMLITVLYIVVILRLRISDEINNLIRSLFN